VEIPSLSPNHDQVQFFSLFIVSAHQCFRHTHPSNVRFTSSPEFRHRLNSLLSSPRSEPRNTFPQNFSSCASLPLASPVKPKLLFLDRSTPVLGSPFPYLHLLKTLGIENPPFPQVLLPRDLPDSPRGKRIEVLQTLSGCF